MLMVFRFLVCIKFSGIRFLRKIIVLLLCIIFYSNNSMKSRRFYRIKYFYYSCVFYIFLELKTLLINTLNQFLQLLQT